MEDPTRNSEGFEGEKEKAGVNREKDVDLFCLVCGSQLADSSKSGCWHHCQSCGFSWKSCGD